MTPSSHASEASIATRRALVNLRAAVYNGDLTLGQLLDDPPIAIRKLALVDIVRWTRYQRHGTSSGITAVGRKAVHDGVNLLVTVERASQRSLRWVGEHGYGPLGEAGQESPARRGGAKRPKVAA